MSITDVQIRTITCNGPNCTKTVTFDVKDHERITADNPWLIATRQVGTSFGASLIYCSDTCEMEATASGAHNPPTPKAVVDISEAGGQNAIRLAAEAAKKAEEATNRLKQGKPIQIK
jgi:hypothetical protein